MSRKGSVKQLFTPFTTESFPAQHCHTARRSLMTIGDPSAMEMSVAIDRIIFSMVERTGNIWMSNLP